jgi:hypothetical protein
MNTEQPLALRLADDIEAVAKTALDDRSVRYKELNDAAACCAAAAELRRQHAEIEALREALKTAVCQNEHDMLMTGEELRQARAALAKGEKT